MTFRHWRLGRAFTIVELLVVMAIIALLVALIIPSLSRARQHAIRTQCLNNIRQIGLGISIYANDHRELPPAERPGGSIGVASMEKSADPVWYSSQGSGLFALEQTAGFERSALSCPEGWASGGRGNWYESNGLNSKGAAYMDYAYWGGRYAPGPQYDVRTASFRYRLDEKGTKILVTDIICDAGAPEKVSVTVGSGNHSSNHLARMTVVRQTDGRGKPLDAANRIKSLGGSVLFSDYHAAWYGVERWAQQADGLCYPPPDHW